MAIENWGFAAGGQAAGSTTPVVNQSDNGIESFLKANGLDMTPDQFYAKYGVAPEGGWTDDNTYGHMSLNPNGGVPSYGAEDQSLQKWIGKKEMQPVEVNGGDGGNFTEYRQVDTAPLDPNLLPNFSLYGSGSKEDIQRGFNILQHLSPRNIGEFGGLSPEVQKAILENPREALLRMQKLANPANGDWLSVGAEGGFSDLGAYQKGTDGNLTADMSKYMQIHDGDSWSGPLSMIATAMQFTPLAPIGYGVNAALAARNDNPLGMVTNGLGIGGLNVAGAIGNAAGLSGMAGNALGSGLLGAAGGAISGKDPLKSGLTSAASSAVGSVVGDATGSDVAKNVASKVTGLIGSAMDKGSTNTNTSTAENGGVAAQPKVSAYRPTKIEKWGYA